MRASDVFENMDSVKKYANSLRDSISEKDYKIILYLLGLLDNEGISEAVELNGMLTNIDKFLVPLIKKLNKCGFQTLACCSGLAEEHGNAIFKPELGYISVLSNDFSIEKIKEIASKIEVQFELAQEVYLRSAITIRNKGNDDRAKKEIWLSFEKELNFI